MISRRDLLKAAGAAMAATEAAASTPTRGDTASNAPAEAPPAGAPFRHDAPDDDQSTPRVPLEALTADEADLLTAIVARLIPSDANGPGAVEAGAVHYIDRALAGALSSSREAYRRGLAALERYARSSRGKPFRDLTPTDQESVLIDVETGSATGSGAASTAVRRPSSPCCGLTPGRAPSATRSTAAIANFVGWDLLGYPGVRTAVTPTTNGWAWCHVRCAGRRTTATCSTRPRPAPPRRERHMATTLKGTDVVIVGLGAAGGVAALPLAEAGLRGDRPRGRHLADAARFRAGRDSQQRARLAAGGAESESRGTDAPAESLGADHARRPVTR